LETAGKPHSVHVTTSGSISNAFSEGDQQVHMSWPALESRVVTTRNKKLHFLQKNVFNDTETIFLTGEYFIFKNLFVD